MELESDFFALFGLPRSYSVDNKKLKASARKLLLRYHPDKMTSATPNERRLAEQFTAHVNHARSILEEPIRRAAHLLNLVGVESNFDNRTIDDREFLMRQMMLREELEEATSAGELDNLQREVEGQLGEIDQLFSMTDFLIVPNEESKLQLTAGLAKMYFFNKFRQDLELQQKALNV